jgi:hypothetical protein
MDVFSGLMGQMNRLIDFRFHWRCEREEITRLCFTDDLMIFCRAEVGSVSLVRNCLDQFWVASGLSANLDKSSMFLCGVDPNTELHFLYALSCREGKLSVRYLGVTKLCSHDCLILVDRIMAKARSSMNRTLSHAGRLQLLNSIFSFYFF